MGPSNPQINPEMRALQQQARDDRVQAVQERLSDDTRDLLIQFGRRKAFAGANLPGLGSMTAGL